VVPSVAESGVHRFASPPHPRDRAFGVLAELVSHEGGTIADAAVAIKGAHHGGAYLLGSWAVGSLEIRDEERFCPGVVHERIKHDGHLWLELRTESVRAGSLSAH
jgi:hypothetical protein